MSHIYLCFYIGPPAQMLIIMHFFFFLSKDRFKMVL